MISTHKTNPIIAALILMSGILSAQQTPFSKVFYDSLGSIQAYSVASTTDNGFVIAGQWNGEALAMKLDSAGVLLWAKRMGGNYHESFSCITSTMVWDDCQFSVSTEGLNTRIFAVFG